MSSCQSSVQCEKMRSAAGALPRIESERPTITPQCAWRLASAHLPQTLANEAGGRAAVPAHLVDLWYGSGQLYPAPHTCAAWRCGRQIRRGVHRGAQISCKGHKFERNFAGFYADTNLMSNFAKLAEGPMYDIPGAGRGGAHRRPRHRRWTHTRPASPHTQLTGHSANTRRQTESLKLADSQCAVVAGPLARPDGGSDRKISNAL